MTTTTTIKTICPPEVYSALKNTYKQLKFIQVNIANKIIPHYLDIRKEFNNYQAQDKNTVVPAKFNCLTQTPLCDIMKMQGSDKALYQGEGKHNYTTFYNEAFAPLSKKPIRFFELGLGTNNPDIKANMGSAGRPGASLRGWKKFFPLANIFGADIDSSILFEEDRIKTFYCDQTDSSIIKRMWDQPELQEDFDVIIDDGLHEYFANIIFFQNSIHKLKVGGIYIIEDILRTELTNWEHTIENYAKEYPNLRFTVLKIPNVFNTWDNNLIVVERIF
ncbi:hypothetical protein [Adhaeribacter aquaticus]|uniref:hypothetical protein n=1 Tax=Adhaeribacter aquaticus TaxID=299567 RepID=UPI0004173FAC|nr:hypothetical protein [Adhaeribacter aquaticus]